MDIQNFSALFNTPARREAFLKLIKDNKTKHIFIQGLEGSSIALFFSNLLEHKQAHIIIANDLDEAGYLYNDLVQINGNDHILLFPSGYKRDIKYGQPDPPSEILRTEVLNRLCQKGESLLIVTYPEAIAEKVVPVNMLSEQTLHIDKNSKCDIITLSDKLRERGFEEVDYVYEPGQFAVRGSILDVFSYTNELPYRIDFFGKEVESIRTFEVETQLSTGKLEEVYIVANVCGQEASGISILDFIDKNTILICHNLSWVIDRISTIASESLSEQTLIAEEGDRYTVDEVWFSYKNGKCIADQRRMRRERDTVKSKDQSDECIFDMLSILMRARSFDVSDYKVGDKILFDMATGTKVEQQTLIYRGRKNFKAENGVKYRCLVFSLVEYKKGKEKEVITFYVTDDKNHLPVRLDLYLNFGSAKAFLREIKGNRHPLTSIIEK